MFRAGRLRPVAAAAACLLALAGAASAEAAPKNGKLVFYTDDGLSMVNADGTGETPLDLPTPNGFAGYGSLDWSPDGKRIAFASGTYVNGDWRQAIFVINADGTGLRRITDGRAPHGATSWDTSPSWSPDGKEIVFAADRDASTASGSQLYRVSLDGGEPVEIPIGGVRRRA